jgi:hypothetical protein
VNGMLQYPPQLSFTAPNDYGRTLELFDATTPRFPHAPHGTTATVSLKSYVGAASAEIQSSGDAKEWSPVVTIRAAAGTTERRTFIVDKRYYRVVPAPRQPGEPPVWQLSTRFRHASGSP